MKPLRIFFIRHGESEGNKNKNIYLTKPDYALLLTDKGKAQAIECGKKLAKIIKKGNAAVYYSPFFRTRQTSQYILFSFVKNKVTVLFEEPRLREQEWSTDLRLREDGTMSSIQKARDEYSPFYYRFESGESCADVFDRVSDFLNTLHRDFQKKDFPENVIIVTHGMTMRLLIMKWLHLTVEEFEFLANPKNCEIWELESFEYNNKIKYKLKTLLRKYKKRKCKFSWELGKIDKFLKIA